MSDILNSQLYGTPDSYMNRTHISTQPEEFFARVKHEQHESTLIYKRKEECVLLQRRNQKGKTVNIANIPIWCIVNVETVKERQMRLRRVYSDAEESNPLFALHHSKQSGSNSNNSNSKNKKKNLLQQMQKPPQRGVDETVYLHSRVVSDITSNVHRRSPTSSESPTLAESAFDGLKECEEGDTVYYLYSVKQSSTSSLVPKTMEFTSFSDAASRADVQYVVQRILNDVYPRGTKRLILFVSPKSGSGNAVTTCQKHVMPVLRLTRHSLKVIVTTRAGHCEDSIADTTNALNDNDVLVCVGGDGIIHEAVNGLDRRGLINSWSFTVPSTSINNNNNNNNNNENNNTRNTIPPAVSTHTESSRLSMGMKEEEDEEENNNAKENEVNRREKERKTGEYKNDMMYGSEYDSNKIGEESSLHHPSRVHLISPSQSTQSSNLLMPMLATIPAGSGCGMAKTLNVVTVRESVLALVHLHTCVKDLMRLRFEHNNNNNNNNNSENKKETKKTHKHSGNNGSNGNSSFGDGFTPLSGLLSTGRGERSGVNSSSQETEGNTTFTNRVAFMSTTFGVVNKIDEGSEKLRCLGNCRFLLYAIYTFIRGVRSYGVRFRYLPWKGNEGRELQKMTETDVMPTEMEFPHCTIDHTCLHCQMHNNDSNINNYMNTVGNGTSLDNNNKDNNEGLPQQRREGREEDVNLDDVNLPWVSLDGNHCNIFISNIREVTRDVMIAPFAHMSDGAIDVVYSMEKDVKLGRKQFLKFFLGLEKGKHIELPFVSYVKAQAIELEALEGGLMSDGEVMPFTKVRITPVRRAAEFVRGK